MKERHAFVEGLEVYINYNTILSILTKKIFFTQILKHEQSQFVGCGIVILMIRIKNTSVMRQSNFV